MLLAFDDLELAGEARSGSEALDVCKQTRPDVVLMDMKMGTMDGIATTRALKQELPDLRILMLTSYHDRGLVQQALLAGAIGYLLKDASKDEVADGIRAAFAGRTSLSSEVAADLVNEVDPASEIGSDLTERELDVFEISGSRSAK